MPDYAKFVMDMVITKRSVSFEDDDRMQHYRAISTRSLMQKKEDPGAFTIPCTVGLLHFTKPLCDLSASINLMPLSIYKKLGLGDPKPTKMRLMMTDRIVKRRIGLREEAELKNPHDFYAQEHTPQNIAEKSTQFLFSRTSNRLNELKIEERKLKIGGAEERKLKIEAELKIGGAKLILLSKIG
nr:uncharacterized protein LOC104647719 [Solanum lycopersicum]